MTDRRKHYRTDCRITACIEEPGLIQADQYCRTSNISMKGVLIPNAPLYPVGTKCKVAIHDRADDPLRLDVIVSHHSSEGTGFTFTNLHIDDCLRLKHIVKPVWDGKDFLEGMLLMLRYSPPTTELKDCLALTTFLSSNTYLFTRHPHDRKSCPVEM